MAKKTYKTYRLKGLQILFFDESGCAMEVNFRGGVQIDSTAKFSTSDEKIQKALEECSGFNRDFYLESVSEDRPADAPVREPEEENPVDTVAETEEIAAEETAAEDNVVNVATKSDAIEWLKEHFPEEGYTSVKLRTRDAVTEAGKKHGILFEFTA